MSDLAGIVNTLSELSEYKETHQAEFYTPYEFQKAFHFAREGQVYDSGHYEIGEGEVAEERALICANQIGKTMSAAMETAYHATGDYPDWWQGVRFDYAPSIVCIGKSNDSVMKVIQNELMGDPLSMPDSLGTGSIPKDKIVKTNRKPGVVNALSSVVVKHKSGKNSQVWFMAYEQDTGAMMGIRNDIVWADEEPPQDVMSQMKRSQLSRKQKAIYSTFTPEEGVTQVVDQLLNDMQAYQAVVRATWDDAPHMTPEMREKELSKFPPHERDMRSRGIPMMGSGLVFAIPDEQIMTDPIKIPAHWPRICAVDFGWDHPFASVWIAWDRDNDTAYVYDAYRESKALPPIHASSIRHRGGWIPIAWPHDGLQTDKASGIPLADQYRKEGLKLLPNKFSNPPAPGQKEGQGGNGVEAGIFAILTAMEEGRFKVFSTLNEWFEEKRQYHRKDGKIVALRDDLMSATRYAFQSLRFARTQPIQRVRASYDAGMSNW